MWIISIILKGTQGGHMSTEASPNSVQGTAIVTGASSGLGKVYADRLAKRGYDLILIARRGDRLEELARQLRKDQGVSVETLVADLGNPSDLQRWPTVFRLTI